MVTVRQASAFDMLEALNDSGARSKLTRARFGEMARQVSEGAAITLRDDAGVLIAVAGLWPEADHAEAWLAVGPAFRANLLPALRQLRLSMGEIAQAAGVEEVRAYVRPMGGERVAGARMAAWLGLEPAGEDETPIGRVLVYRRVYGAADDHG